MKFIMVFLLVLSLSASLAEGRENWKAHETRVYPSLDSNYPVYQSKDNLKNPSLTLSPGSKVGDTWYDEQHNGTISKQIAIDPNPSGCAHFYWMKGLDPTSSNRHVYYNFDDPPMDSIGVQIDPGNTARAGYITGDFLSDGRAVAAYHARLSGWLGTDIASAVSIDLIGCLGAFNQTFPDTVTIGHVSPGAPIWPHVAVDIQDFIHVVSHPQTVNPGDPGPVYYSRSTDFGVNFSPWTLAEDSIYTISYDIQTSRQSGKVTIAYCHGVPWAPSQINEDVYYLESTDNGSTWDFSNPINVTNFTPSDTLRAYADVSALYDNNDSLHLAFPLRFVEGDSLFFFASLIAHWSKETGLTIVNSDTAIGWHSQYNAGGFRMMADRPSLGIDPTTGYLYIVFVGNPPGDISGSSPSWPNGELFATCSGNGGLNWGPAINLTNTPTPGCTPGNCEDDDWPSLAEIVDDNLHILYINDKDAGGDAGGQRGEGVATLNPMLYLKVPKNTIPCAVGVEEGKEVVIPKKFSLSQNIPNPFSSASAITFTLPRDSEVSLDVFDLSGREIKSLVSGELKAGYHSIRWDGKNSLGQTISSGVYFYRLNVGANGYSPAFTQTRKMVILR